MVTVSSQRNMKRLPVFSNFGREVPSAGDSFYARDRGLVEALDAERGDLIEGCPTMLGYGVPVFESNVFSQIRYRNRRLVFDLVL